MTATTDERVLFDVDQESRIATITLNNPTQRNSYDAAMRDAIGRGAVVRSRRSVQYRGGYEQRLRLVRR